MKIGNLEVYGVIYKITNKVNGKVYIGQTITGFDRRYGNNLSKRTSNRHLKYSIQKYGIDNFNISKVFDIAFSKEELDIKEKCWISIYKSTNSDYGYNSEDGGSNGKPNEETRIKLSESMKGRVFTEEHRDNIRNALIGKPLSEERKEKISKSLKGKRTGKENSFYGKHHSEESRRKMSESRKGRVITEEWRKHISDSNKKKVICITTGKIFNSVKEASEYYNIKCSSSISACCKGKLKSCGKLEDGTKLVWSYFYGENEVVA